MSKESSKRPGHVGACQFCDGSGVRRWSDSAGFHEQTCSYCIGVEDYWCAQLAQCDRRIAQLEKRVLYMAHSLRIQCDHEGIGIPGCPTCDPLVRDDATAPDEVLASTNVGKDLLFQLNDAWKRANEWSARARAAEMRAERLDLGLRRFFSSPAVIVGYTHNDSENCPTWYDCCHCEENDLRRAFDDAPVRPDE